MGPGSVAETYAWWQLIWSHTTNCESDGVIKRRWNLIGSVYLTVLGPVYGDEDAFHQE